MDQKQYTTKTLWTICHFYAFIFKSIASKWERTSHTTSLSPPCAASWNSRLNSSKFMNESAVKPSLWTYWLRSSLLCEWAMDTDWYLTYNRTETFIWLVPCITHGFSVCWVNIRRDSTASSSSASCPFCVFKRADLRALIGHFICPPTSVERRLDVADAAFW